MLASTHLDPVVGIDIHWEMVPDAGAGAHADPEPVRRDGVGPDGARGRRR